LLEEQDRSLWDSAQILEGREILGEAVQRRMPGPFQLQAAIADLHAEAVTPKATDWTQIVALYDRLFEMQPTPVVALNRAVAVAMARGAEHGLAEVERLGQRAPMKDYLYYHSARAELLRRLGKTSPAREAYEQALKCAKNAAQRRFLTRRLSELA
jgi:RNA polymerase sigma-70 factor (ECF subfamily)